MAITTARPTRPRSWWPSTSLRAKPPSRLRGNSQAVARLRIATSRRWTDKDGERHEETEWHDVEVWGKPAEAAGEHLAKGRQVYVEGRLKTDTWTDKQSGQKRYRTKIVAEEVRFIGARPTPADHVEAPTPDDAEASAADQAA